MKRILLALLALPLFWGCNDIQPPGKYEGGNELVSSVTVASYSLGTLNDDGSPKANAQIDIRITLKDSRTIDILYRGPTPYDDYY